jgi:methyltransferase
VVIRLGSGYRLLVAAVAAERLAELVVSARHRRWAAARGGVESGAGHYPAMVGLHAGLLVGCAMRAVRGPAPPAAVGGWMTGVVLAAQALRWWCIAALGRQWNTRVIVVPGAPLVHRGPYRWLRHPNYLAVAVEGAALPLAGGARGLAAAFSAVNVALLTLRIRVENRALATLSDGPTWTSTC